MPRIWSSMATGIFTEYRCSEPKAERVVFVGPWKRDSRVWKRISRCSASDHARSASKHDSGTAPTPTGRADRLLEMWWHEHD
ncbi:hypothetical protein SD37_10215 [Amycolatopsis orientalis]|uniref:Uncharacterized protein n=1 Tax=Amycolatopsis orientalis TaxID=31958 RepID=A0A193BUX9_AMYOR|nr:hypothetical protein SD37_10215 [Amycolatopsis orientalis]